MVENDNKTPFITARRKICWWLSKYLSEKNILIVEIYYRKKAKYFLYVYQAIAVINPPPPWEFFSKIDRFVGGGVKRTLTPPPHQFFFAFEICNIT